MREQYLQFIYGYADDQVQKVSLVTAILNAFWLYLFSALMEILAILEVSKYWYIFVTPLITYLLSFTFTTICLFYLLRIESLKRFQSRIKQFLFIIVVVLIGFIGWILVYMISTELLLKWNFITLLLMGCVWVPQIIKNAVQNTAWPPFKYTHAVMMLQAIFIVYIRGFPDNLYQIRPDFNFTLTYLLLLCFQAFFLYG